MPTLTDEGGADRLLEAAGTPASGEAAKAGGSTSAGHTLPQPFAPTLSAVQTAAVSNGQAATPMPVPTAASQATVSVPVGHPAFSQAVGEQISWMTGQGQHAVQMHLNPPQLGPLSVHVHVNGDQTQVLFQTHHPSVRSALEATASHLRDLLGQGGQQTVSVSVDLNQQGTGGQQAFQQGGAQSQPGPWSSTPSWSAGTGAEGGGAEPDVGAGWRIYRRGLFDTYV
ncbi:MAG: flagellar hook-length control protein FliK [Gammaproteobacteria bacterium]